MKLHNQSKMVRVQVKHGKSSGEKEFLYDCETTSQIDEIAKQVIQISNLQSQIDRLAVLLEPRLAPLHGNPKVLALIRALSEAKSYASKNQVQYSRPLLHRVLRNHVQSIEREVAIDYVLLGFSDSSQFQQLLAELEILEEDTTQLWWAGKELIRSKKLSDYVGSNEKTKIMLKLMKPSSNSA